MRSHVSLWSGPRMVFTHRRGPLFSCGWRVAPTVVAPSTVRRSLPLDDLVDPGPVKAHGLADFGHRKAGLGSSLEALPPCRRGIVNSGLGALESSLRSARLAAGLLLFGVGHRGHPRSSRPITAT